MNLASTNYPEKLDRRIIARPRRFDRILRIDSPCRHLREAYLARKLPRQSAESLDLESHKIRIEHGTGSEDRYVLFGKSFATALRTHMAAHPQNRWLFQTRRCSRYSTRRIEQIVKQYAEAAGVRATPHTFRHQAITWLTRHSGLADAELQLITGHARRETLANCQHTAFDGDLEKHYQDAMWDVEL